MSETESDLDSTKPAQFLLTNAADKRPSRWSRSTRTNHTDLAAKAIELCFVISTRLLFKAAGQQLILIRVDGAGRTTTNQHMYSRVSIRATLSLYFEKSSLQSGHYIRVRVKSNFNIKSFNWHLCCFYFYPKIEQRRIVGSIAPTHCIVHVFFASNSLIRMVLRCKTLLRFIHLAACGIHRKINGKGISPQSKAMFASCALHHEPISKYRGAV